MVAGHADLSMESCDQVSAAVHPEVVGAGRARVSSPRRWAIPSPKAAGWGQPRPTSKRDRQLREAPSLQCRLNRVTGQFTLWPD
jgi:hypothetical protein